MNVIIITEPDDIHAILVKLALEKKGHQCDLFFSADMPSKQENSVYCEANKFQWFSKSNHYFASNLSSQEYSVVWWRRPRKPFVPEYAHPNDKSFIKKENWAYHHSLPYLFNKNAWWINPFESQTLTQSKIVQLKIAQQCGLTIPTTLISNAPRDIKSFIAQHSATGVIYKPFTPHHWTESDSVRLLYTNKIRIEDLPTESMIKIVPGIYQAYVDKKFELRITCFGSHLSAIKIDSQNSSTGKTDWRKIPHQEHNLSEVPIPHSLQEKILTFMKRMNIVFGCFDFILTPNNEYVFLEVNEQGQFLWVEEYNPDICYLDMFTDYLIHADFNFYWKQNRFSLHSAEFDAAAQTIMTNNIEHHIYLNEIKRIA